MRFFYTPRWLHYLQPDYVWRRQDAPPRTLFLTFDDGPIPEVTPFVLDTLAQYNAKATFFCVGDNVRKHPDILQQVLAQGHSIGNHTYNHLNGWKTDNETYLANVESCTACLPEGTTMFRPPYGKLKRSQRNALKGKYKLIMWNLLTYDFDNTFPPAHCLYQTKRYTKEGAIIVFHDSLKAERNLRYVLPLYLEWATHNGYTFEKL
ncbi:MAG: polysaccharide deacetylase family protein [Bacteroidetes bacterium]|nr:MAG: polysaccharide deacetylase family protein [Bacteroidota bacterium]